MREISQRGGYGGAEVVGGEIEMEEVRPCRKTGRQRT